MRTKTGSRVGKFLCLVVLNGCAGNASSQVDSTTYSEDLVPYFAGKDEYCLSQRREELTVDLKRLIRISDIYPGGDRETYCTIVVHVKGTDEVRRFSLSDSGCAPLKEKTVSDTLTLEVTSDHVCKVLE